MKSNRISKKLWHLLLMLIMVLGIFCGGSREAFALTNVIESVEVSDLDLPVIGATPDYEVSVWHGYYHLASADELRELGWDSAKVNSYSDGVAWFRSVGNKSVPMNKTDKFAAGEKYFASIVLAQEFDYRFISTIAATGTTLNYSESLVSSNSKIYTKGSAEAFELVSVTFGSCAKIDKVEVSDIALPRVGQKPDYKAVLPKGAHYKLAGDEKYTKNGICWWQEEEGSDGPDSIATNTVFEEDHFYGFTVTVCADPGYAFTPETEIKVNGKEDEVEYCHRDSIKFDVGPYLAESNQPTIKTVDISGVTLPIIGQSPDYDIILPKGAHYKLASKSDLVDIGYDKDERARYTNGICWCMDDPATDVYGKVLKPTDKFAAGKTYYFEAMLIPKDGYKFTFDTRCRLNRDSDLADNCYSYKRKSGFHFISKELTAADPEKPTVKKGKTYKVKTQKYKVTDADTSGEGKVSFSGSTTGKTKLTSITIPDTVKIDGATFTVTSIGANALKNYTKLKTVKIGKNVKTIGKYAFKSCKKLTSIQVKGTKLTTVGEGALKGISPKCKIKVPASKLKAYKKLLAKKGQAKTVKISK